MSENEILEYTKEIEKGNDLRQNYFNRGIAKRALGQNEEAIEDYGKVIEIDPNYKEAYFNRGNAKRALGKNKEAIEDYSKAIEIDPDYKKAYFNRGNAKQDLGEKEEAIEDYSKAIEIDPNYKKAYFNRGNAKQDLGENEEAIEDYSKAIEIDPNYKDAYFNKGIAKRALGQNEEAIEDYSKAIEIDPNYKEAYNNRGVAKRALGQNEEAIEDYSKAIEIDPHYKLAYSNRKIVYEKIQDQSKVEQDQYTIQFLSIKDRDEKFFKYINKFSEEELSLEIKAKIGELYTATMDLKKELIYTDDQKVGHYTKLNNLKFLFKSNKQQEKNKARLRLNNVAYMNDPTEGMVLIKILGEEVEELYGISDEKSRQVLRGKNNVFLTSFSSAIDTSLPMWVQYGQEGNGCCIVFNENFFDQQDKESLMPTEADENNKGIDMDNNKIINKEQEYYCLYKMQYIKYNEKTDTYDIDGASEKIKKQVDEIRKKVKALQNKSEIINNIMRNILDQVRFLFKDKNYEHEKELRLIKFENNGKVKFTTDAEGFVVPHVYVEVDRELDKNTVEEVVLGPRVQEPIEVANYLYYTDKVDKVTKSRIKYR